MNFSTELLIGIILIVIGLLLGATAYIVLSSRNKEDQIDQEEEQDEEAEDELEDEHEAEPAELVDAEIDEIVEQKEDIDESDLAEEPEEEPIPDQPVLDDTESDAEDLASTQDDSLGPEVVSAPDSPEPDTFTPEPEPGPRIQVAMLLRDEVSGELIVQVGDREYRTANELRDSRDWTRVEFAASDLSKWIEEPVERPAPERDVEASERSGPLSMIEQINEILQEKIEASGQSHLAVRLIEGTEGSARVLIGLHSYELGEVPDESISNLIREAVAEWEASS